MTGRRAWLAACLVLGAAAPARAQDWLFVEAIADGELWATDSGSVLLSRDNGHAAPVGRLQLFTAVAPRPSVQVIFSGEVEGGSGSTDGETEFYNNQLVFRYVPSPRVVVDVGKFPSPVGAFSNRRLSTTNPLIGLPDGYPPAYPWGVEVSGSASRVDYRVALVSLPVTHAGYLPDPSPALRPALGGGVTPVPDLRIGASFTWGPYLNSDLAADLPAGADWKDFGERVLGFDTRISHGYFDFHGELAFSHYEVPTQSAALDGVTYYGEAKQAWGPRFFTAVRLERNDYPFVRPRSGSPWTSRLVDVSNGEVGLGFRVDVGTTVKVSYRRSWVDPALQGILRNGYAVAFQVSYHVDVKRWVEGRR